MQLHPFKQNDAPAIPPPIVEKPITTPPVQTPTVIPPPVKQPPVVPAPPPTMQQQQAYYPQRPPMKKGMGAGWIIGIILLSSIVIGIGTVAFLQYNGNINIEALRNIIPAKDQPNKSYVTISNPASYYIVQSFAIIDSKWTAIVSDIVISKRPYNNEEGVKNQFKKAIMVKYPNIYNLFMGNIIVNKYNTLPEAENAHSSLIKTYDAKQYDINTINFVY